MRVTRRTQMTKENAQQWVITTKAAYIKRMEEVCPNALSELPKEKYPLPEILEEIQATSESISKKYSMYLGTTPDSFIVESIDSDRGSSLYSQIIESLIDHKEEQISTLEKEVASLKKEYRKVA